jgi:hypothetical protein
VLIQNNSSLPIELVQLQVTCGCTVVDCELPKLLSAGEKLSIPVEVNFGRGDGVRRNSIFAVFKREKTQATAIPATQGVFRIDLVGAVIPEIRAIPPVIDFGDIVADGTEVCATQKFTLQVEKPDEYLIRSVECSDSRLKIVSPLKLLNNASEFTVTFSSPNFGHFGMISSQITVNLEGGRVESFVVPVQGVFQPLIEVPIDDIVFSSRSPAGSSFDLIIRGRCPFTVATLNDSDASNTFFTTSITSAGNSTSVVKVVLLPTSNSNEGVQTGSFLLKAESQSGITSDFPIFVRKL